MKQQFYIAVDTLAVFEFDDEKTTLDEAVEAARDLAFNPNYHTIENGTQLIKLHLYETRGKKPMQQPQKNTL